MGTPGFLTEVQCTYEFPFLCEVAQEASEQLTTPLVSSQGTPRDISDLVTETSAQLTTQGAKSKGAPEDKSDRTLLAVKIAVPSVVSGLLCGAVMAVVCTYLMRRKRQIRVNVQLHFGARYVRRKPTGDPANVVNTSTQNIEDSNINQAILDHIPDLNRDVDIPSVHVDPYHELEDGDTYDSIAESGLQLNRALPPLPDDMGGSLRGSVDEGDVEGEKGGYCIGRVGHCKEECNDGTE
ncbi:hypothetical protein DPMN_040369 [Dreissena polymorpha]|uniref:Uncharacterized protein n=1 Tax=Dreissena polymorpha TaxID=45954 RepID=A0A9D4HT01_DREPO|nr:hypothetical protein DPMN_040369 [Dreissena polymorpha]